MFIVKMSWKSPDTQKVDTTWRAKAVQIEGSRLTIDECFGYRVEYDMRFVTWLEITQVE